MSSSKSVEEYLALPYQIELIRDEGGDGHVGWVAWVEELPGCVSQGDTPEEAAAMIQEAMGGWFEVALKHGDPIPEPRQGQERSGRLLVRMPRSLHADLEAAAQQEGVSLNQLVVGLLASGVGWRSRRDAPRAPKYVRSA